MAFAATVEWDVRTTGAADNGGGFDPVSGTPGTDYSQQDAAQVTYTDLVIDGTTNTNCTSAGTPFTSAHVGNIINITSGTGFTVQRVQIMSVAAGVATCDKSLGTLSSTGGNGKLGGSLTTIAAANTLAVATNTIHIKAGTYTLTASITTAVHVQFWGYNATHEDGGTKPLITTATNSTPLFVLGAVKHTFRNVHFSNTAATRANALEGSANFAALMMFNCLFDGFTCCVAENGGGIADASFSNCEFKNNAANNNTFVRTTYRLHFHGCFFHDLTGAGSSAIVQDGSTHFSIVDCIFADIAAIAANPASMASIINCSFYACGTPITTTNYAGLIVNNIFYGTTAYSVNVGTFTGIMRNNAYNAVGSGLRTGTFYPGSDFSDILLTGDPFTAAASDDFTLNSTAGAGAACKSAGIQWS
jgi:hypothetical protein